MRKFAEVVMEQPSFRDPSAFDPSTFACMGCMMAYMKKSSFETIPDATLRSAITAGNVKDMKMSSKKMVRKTFFLRIKFEVKMLICMYFVLQY